MRISVRSPIVSSSTRVPAAFQGPPDQPKRGRGCPALPRRPLRPRLSRGLGGALWVPGCGEEIIPLGRPLGVAAGRKRVAPVAENGWRGNINPLPFCPLSALDHLTPGLGPSPPPREGAGREPRVGGPLSRSHRELRTG